MKNIILYICVLFIELTVFLNISCSNSGNNSSSNNELSGSISISGAFALYPLTSKWAEEFCKIHPNVRIDISAGGAGKGMVDVLSEVVELAMFSREVSNEEISQGAWFIAVARDAVLPTINTENPVKQKLMESGLTRKQFQDIFINNRISTWEQATGIHCINKINVYTRSDACGAAEMWAKYLSANQENLNGVGVYGDPGMASAVKSDPYAIGYNNVIYAYDVNTKKTFDGIDIIPLDINSDGMIDSTENFYSNLDLVMSAIRDRKYPSPPARDLFLVSKGKPENPLVIAFLKWILSDGQNFVNEAGYVKLTDNQLIIEQEKVK